TLTLAIFSLPSCSFAIFSRWGAIILQGWHHSAQKSTRTGVSDSRTSAWNVPSVTATGCAIVLPSVVAERSAIVLASALKSLPRTLVITHGPYEYSRTSRAHAGGRVVAGRDQDIA